MKFKKITQLIGGDKIILLAATMVVFAMFTMLNKNFLTWRNISGILVASSLVGLVSIGHTYLIIAGLNDLSPGSLCALAGVISALLVSQGIPFFPALLITLGVGAIVGIFNAFMVNNIKLDPFIATLVTQSICRGFAYIFSDGRSISISDPTFLNIGKTRFLSLSLPVWILLISFVIFGFVLSKTTFGRKIYAIGGNKDAARLAGLDPKRIVLICYIMMGLLCGLGGTVLASRMNSGQPAACVNLEFDSITAVILGGVSFTGGIGSMGCTVLGVLLIQSFNQGLTMVNVPSFWQYVAKGGLLLFALTSDYLRKQNREKNLLEASMKNA